MKKIMMMMFVLALCISFSAVTMAAPRTAKTQCQKWALEDNTVKPWELSEFVKQCTASLEKSGVANAKRFQWKR